MIYAVACESPSVSGRPIDFWTGRELADELIKRKIVPSISVSHVNRLLARADLKPYRMEYYLNTTEKDPELFEQQVQTVCQTYLQAPDLYFQHNTHTVCVDEMTGIQALERKAPTKPMVPGKPTQIEYEYKRHGTLCLIGSWHVVEGQMIASTIRPTRKEEDFCWHICQTVAGDPHANCRFVLDNLNIHCSESLVRYVAQQEGIDENTLGEKEKSGVLKSMESRREFLSDANRRIRFVYLPKHSSWLNQIEIVFGIVSRRVLRRGNFPSVDALKERLIDFLDYFNRTFARPFRWTYTGRPLTAAPAKRPATWREKWASRREFGELLALAA